MGDVAPEGARLGDTDHGVEVRPVEIHLTAVLVHHVAHFDDRVLEHAVRRRIGDHDRRERICVLLRLGPQVGQVDVSVVVGFHDNNSHAGHRRRCRIRSVGRRRNEAHVAMPFTPGLVIRPDGQQPRELTLRPGVRLHRDGVVAGEVGEPAFHVGDEADVPLNLVEGCERMDVGELRPRHGCQLGGGVELHRA